MHTPFQSLEVLEYRNLLNATADNTPIFSESIPQSSEPLHTESIGSVTNSDTNDSADSDSPLYFDVGFIILTGHCSVMSASMLVSSIALAYKKDYPGVVGTGLASVFSLGCTGFCLAFPFALWSGANNLAVSIVAWSVALTGYSLALPIYGVCWYHHITQRCFQDCDCLV